MKWRRIFNECRYCIKFEKYAHEYKLNIQHWLEHQDKCVCARIERENLDF